MWGQLEDEYQRILQRVKGGASILDLGCALAQDLRCLASDGAPTERMYATGMSRHCFKSKQVEWYDNQITQRSAAGVLGPILRVVPR